MAFYFQELFQAIAMTKVGFTTRRNSLHKRQSGFREEVKQRKVSEAESCNS